MSNKCGVCGVLLATPIAIGEDPHCEDCGYPNEFWDGNLAAWGDLSKWFGGWKLHDTELLPVEPSDLAQGLLYIGVTKHPSDKNSTKPLVLIAKGGIFYTVGHDDEYVKLEDQKSIIFVMLFLPPKRKDI